VPIFHTQSALDVTFRSDCHLRRSLQADVADRLRRRIVKQGCLALQNRTHLRGVHLLIPHFQQGYWAIGNSRKILSQFSVRIFSFPLAKRDMLC
jgi:hypothetical protein